MPGLSPLVISSRASQQMLHHLVATTHHRTLPRNTVKLTFHKSSHTHTFDLPRPECPTMTASTSYTLRPHPSTPPSTFHPPLSTRSPQLHRGVAQSQSNTTDMQAIRPRNRLYQPTLISIQGRFGYTLELFRFLVGFNMVNNAHGCVVALIWRAIPS